MSQSSSEAVHQTEAQHERSAQRFHVEFLRQELERRKQRNARYSLRAFASLLGIHPSALSRILSGKQEVSLLSATALLKQLTMTPEERLWFIRSVAEERYRRAIDELTADGGDLHVPREAIATMERKLFELCLGLLSVSSSAELLRVSSLYLRDFFGAVSVSVYRPHGKGIEQVGASNEGRDWPQALPHSFAPFDFQSEVTSAPQLSWVDGPLHDGHLQDGVSESDADSKLRVALLPLLAGNRVNGLLLMRIRANDLDRDHRPVADLSRLLGQALACLIKRENPTDGASAE